MSKKGNSYTIKFDDFPKSHEFNYRWLSKKVHIQGVVFFQERGETVAKCSILFKFKEGEDFNRRNTLSISRIELKLHFVQNVESDAEIGQKGAFSKGLAERNFGNNDSFKPGPSSLPADFCRCDNT